MNRRSAFLRVVVVSAVMLVPGKERGALAAQGPGGQAESAGRPCELLKRKNGELPRLVINHRSLDRAAECSIRLARGDQLWVDIADANELIYEYKLVDVAIPAPTVPQLFASFLGASAPAPAGSTTRAASVPVFATSPDSQTSRHAALTARLARAAQDVRDVLDTSEAIGLDPLLPDSLHDRLRRDVDSLEARATNGVRQARTLDDLWNWAGALKDSIGPPKSNQDTVRARVQRDHETLSHLYPEAAEIARRLKDLRLGKLFLWSNDKDGATRLRLSVRPRLSANYQSRRVTTTADVGLNILRISPVLPWFQATVGLSWTPFAKRITYSDRTSGDSTFFEHQTRDRLTPVPSTYFGIQRPIGRGDWVAGGGVGVGVRIGTGNLQLKDALDYSLFLTIGYQWLRLHVGGVWSAEVDESALPAPDSTGRRFTISNRRLADYSTTRHAYLFFGVAYTP